MESSYAISLYDTRLTVQKTCAGTVAIR